MNAEILSLDLTFRRKSIIGYSIGMAVYVLVVVALYPAFKDSSSLDALTADSSGVAALLGISGSLTSPTGWMNANLYANFFPLLILMLTIGYGAACIAGQEHDGHLELVMSLPFTRSRVVAQKTLCLIVQALIFAVVVLACTLIGRGFQLSIDTTDLATTTAAVMVLGIDFGLLAMVVGAATGNRGLAIGAAAAVAAASYLASSMAPLVSWLSPIRYLSLFYWSVGNNQLEHGVALGGAAVLIGTGAALAALAIHNFKRHDLS